MTRQEMFEKAVRGLHAQGYAQSRASHNGRDPSCAYRGVDDRRCAVGHLIPDEAYQSTLEGYSPCVDVDGPNFVARTLITLGVAPDDIDWLRNLQGEHDGGRTPEEMRANLLHFAKAHGLTFPKDC